MATAPSFASTDRVLRVEIPEQVELGFEMADLGSRFVALLLDGLVLAGFQTGLALLGYLLVKALGTGSPVVGWGGLVLVLTTFAVMWGYFTYFEGFRNGRTPGKKWVGLRVVHEGSHPMTLRGAAIRNLLRLVDMQPAMSWMVGGLAMMLSPRTQRLGDMAAGTLVVRDRGAIELSEAELARLMERRTATPRLADEAFGALERFVARREEMEPKARARLASRLVEALASTPAALKAGEEGEGALVAVWEEERARRGPASAGMAAASPLVFTLVRSQGAQWIEYRRLLGRAERKGLASLKPPDLERFARLYRLAAADLARARTYRAPPSLVFTLERWVGSGHNLLYRPGLRTWSALAEWLRYGFPRLVRARRWYVAAAAAMLFVPALAGYGAVRRDPPLARELLPGTMIARAETAKERAAAGGQYVEVPELFMPVMSSGIIANNVQVTFAVFAAGITAGVGTVALLAFNGLNLGAVAALFENEGAARMVWSFVAPHGVLELTAVCIAGAAGLLLAAGLVAPGRRTRTAALAWRAKEAVSLLAGTTLLLVLAGLIEGLVSPARIPVAAKLAIAGAVALGLVAYLTLAGRRRPVTGDRGT